ncbi:hypothetical protein AFLA70_15g004922 [Aspergillus flavus AF70]|nr:hypothetical protein AFLA70_15g004922 [Aspergillus flavus AF70]
MLTPASGYRNTLSRNGKPRSSPLTQSKVSGADVITLYINNLTHPPNQDHGTEASVHGIPSTSQTVLLSDTAVETTMIPEFPNIVDIWLHDIPIRLPRINAISKLVRRWLQVSPSCPVPRFMLKEVLVSVESAANRISRTAGHRTWTRSGQLFSDMFAIDAHRDFKEPSDTPWFLREIQTRLFACMYQDDKVISNILGKLPRVPRHYCNRKLPLDISDESLLTPGLTPEGYSRQESSPSDWFRARYIFATLREEILSIRLGPMNACNEALIRRISTRIQKAWEGLPSRLCYDPNCTNFSMPYHYLARLLLYLEYLDLNLCTQQVLFDILGKEDDTELLKAAMMLMATTANSMRRFSRKFGASKDTATIVRS